jgi:hypothetical protein
MSELFKLKPCDECNGTGDAHHQGHDYDCPDCLGTGYEEPARRIMNLELMLNGYNVLLQSSDTRYYKIAQKLEIALEQRDRLAEALRKLADCDWVITLPDRMDAVRTIANEALQSLTPNTKP